LQVLLYSLGSGWLWYEVTNECEILRMA